MNVLVKSSAALAVTSAAMSAEIFSSDNHVFAAIERHRQAHKAFVEAITAADDASTGTTALKRPPKVCIGVHKKGSFSQTATGADGSYTITWTPNLSSFDHLNLRAQMATLGCRRISFIKMLEGFRGLEQVNIKPTTAASYFSRHSTFQLRTISLLRILLRAPVTTQIVLFNPLC